jgi:cytochrome c
MPMKKRSHTNFNSLIWLCLVGFVFTSCADSRKLSEEPLTYDSDNQGWPEHFGFGRLASVREVDSLNTDVRPDGEGLPAGTGLVSRGRLIFQNKCERCHGKNGIDGPFGSLVTIAVKDTVKTKSGRSEKTIGNYWPHATTVYDYIQRAMPYDKSGSLTSTEVYDLTAFLLHANGIIDSTKTITEKTLPQIIMPAKHQFVPDDRKGGREVL